LLSSDVLQNILETQSDKTSRKINPKLNQIAKIFQLKIKNQEHPNLQKEMKKNKKKKKKKKNKEDLFFLEFMMSGMNLNELLCMHT
jgi:ABC-type hemin transport system substrate-binding protein